MSFPFLHFQQDDENCHYGPAGADGEVHRDPEVRVHRTGTPRSASDILVDRLLVVLLIYKNIGIGA